MANEFSKGLRIAGNRLNPKRPVLNPLPPKMVQPVVPPPQTVQPVYPQPVEQVAPVTQSTAQQPSGIPPIAPKGTVSPLQEVLRRKRMLEI